MIDTNVWVSRVLLAGSLAARTVDRASESHAVVVSEAPMEELATGLARANSTGTSNSKIVLAVDVGR